MTKTLFVGIVTLLGLGACDPTAGGDGGGDDGTGTGNTSDGTDPTAGETLTTTNPTTTTDSSTTSTTSTASTTSAESSSTSTDGNTATDSDGESSSTGGASTVTPCQPEMSRADIERWRTEVDSRMPTLGDIILPLTGMSAQTASVGGFADLPDPQAGGFIMDPDGGGGGTECDVWLQDCSEGEKCAAWANDGGSSWNALMCVPVAVDPVGPGETCTVQGSGVSGVDNCDAESMCWAVDGDTNQGTCVALCDGSPEAPTCAPEATACSISNQGVLILCLPICNPLAEECGEGQGCFPVGSDFFQCAPVAGGGEPGDACEFLNACNDGAGCVNPVFVPTCPAGAGGCCSSFCDVSANDPGCLDGQECVPWFADGAEPDVCLEAVGVCGVPA